MTPKIRFSFIVSSKSIRSLSALAVCLFTTVGETWGQGVIHVLPPQPIVYGPLPSSQDLDLNSDGAVDYTLTSDGSTIDMVPRGSNSILSILEPPPDIGAFVVALGPGAEISSSLNPAYVWYGANTDPAGASGIISCMNPGCLGYWQNVNGYAGLQLRMNNETYYGWLHIQNSGIQAGQILDWAYKTIPNQPIFAGEVPEPSTVALIAFGVTIWFRRRPK